MTPLFITGIAFSLSFDAFAVSLSNGCALEKCTLRHAVVVGLWFGLFQAGMPVLGWLGGVYLRDAISAWDHWIAFGLLTAIGLKMIYEGRQTNNGCPAPDESAIMHPGRLLLLAIATSIDALAIGLSFSILGYPIIIPALIIGSITFFMSFLGMKAGEKLYELLEDKVEYAGGLILIVIGITTLLEHLN
ncbi:MAG: manganese efflux pump MntP family protein [Spirochaetia bacterium]